MMNAKCPSCDSKIISFTTNDFTKKRVFSCVECGNEWNIVIIAEKIKRSRWRSFFRIAN
jgi:transcription elongation factor Elf1